MRYAIVSDIHANLQAWQAVHADICTSDVDTIICLGDVIGYGPRPVEVLDAVRSSCVNFVLGNHDAVVAGKLDPALFNDTARYLIDWTCEQLGNDPAKFFGNVPMLIGDDSMLCVHAEAAVPERWSYIVEPEHARPSFELTNARLMFVGHTHLPIVCRYTNGEIDGQTGTDLRLKPESRYLINVGSVGDPRDGIPKACYCIYDDETQKVVFRRLPFDYDAFRADLAATKLPVSPHFLLALGNPKAAAATPLQNDMLIRQDAQASPPPTHGDEHSVRIKVVPAATRNLRRPSTTQTFAAPPSAAAVPNNSHKRKMLSIAGAAAALILVFAIIGLVHGRNDRQPKPAPAVGTQPVTSLPPHSSVAAIPPPARTAPTIAEPPAPAGNILTAIPTEPADVPAPADAAMPADAAWALRFTFDGTNDDGSFSSGDHKAQGNSPPPLAAGASGTAIELDGQTMLKVDSAKKLYSQSITVMAWIRLPADSKQNSFAAIVSKGESEWRLSFGQDANKGNIHFAVNRSRAMLAVESKSPTCKDGQWHHVAGVYDADGGKITIYIDGRKNAEAADRKKTIGRSDTVVTIGGAPDMPNRMLQGTIDEVVIESRAWTGEEIERIFNDAAPPRQDADAAPAAAAVAKSDTVEIIPAENDPLDKIATLLFKGELREAAGLAEKTPDARQLIEDIGSGPLRVMTSFSEQRGQIIELEVAAGKNRFRVDSIDGLTLRGAIVLDKGTMAKSYTFADLSVGEKIKRLGDPGKPENAIFIGLMAARANRAPAAKQYFARARVPLADALARLVEMGDTAGREDQAPAQFARLLKQAQLNGDALEASDVFRQVAAASYSPAQKQAFLAAINRYSEDFKDTAYYRANCAVVITLAAALSSENDAFPDFLPLIADAGGYSPVYDIDLSKLGAPPTYDIDNSNSISPPFKRVAYLLELQKKDSQPQFVFAAMDAFTDDAQKIAIPTVKSGAFFAIDVAKLTVISNVEGVTCGHEMDGGNIEFWPCNYNNTNGRKLPDANGGLYDFDDSPSGPGQDGHGCMQVHNAAARQTVFALNAWRGGGKSSDLGIGNSPDKNPDWTFSKNSGSYTYKRLRVLVSK